MKAINGYIIVEPIVQKEVNGIIWEQSFFFGKVIAIPDKDADGLQVGYVVRYQEYAARPIPVKNYLRCRLSDVYYKQNEDGSIHCLNNKVAVKLDWQSEQTTKSGIVLIESKMPDVLTGVIVSHGTLCEYVEDGMRVLFKREAAQVIEHDKQQYAILRETEVLSEYAETST